MTTPQPSIPELRQRAIQILADDQAESYTSDGEGRQWLAQRMREGFKGFNDMSLASLMQAMADADLGDRHPEVYDALEAEIGKAGMGKVRKTVLTLTILHDDSKDLGSLSLNDLAYECDEGAYVGTHVVTTSEPLAADEVEPEAVALGSDSSFFQLDEDLAVDDLVSRLSEQDIPDMDLAAEFFPGATPAEIGWYDFTSCNVSEEARAQAISWLSTAAVIGSDTAEDGSTQDYALRLGDPSQPLQGIPEALRPAIQFAVAKDLSYLLVRTR